MVDGDHTVDNKIFATCFAAIVATSFCFILRAFVIDQWGIEFALTETQKGELLGVGLWPFAISIILLSLVIDRIGFRTTLWLAAAGHVIGLVVLLSATGYWSLYAGTFIMALANGAIEAGANPLVATIFRLDKPRWLNRLHAAWPGGMIIGGLLAIWLGDGVGWRIKVALMALPILVYALLLVRRRFPASERVTYGVSYKSMLAEAGYVSALIVSTLIMLEIGRVFSLPTIIVLGTIAMLTAVYAYFARSAGKPLFIVLVLLMIPLATTELSTDSWISSLMAPEMRTVGLDAGWVLVYTSIIVFVVRIFAGSIIARLGPVGTLALASAFAALGLYTLSGSTGLAILVAATLYGIGKSFFWGTSLALTSEQFPRGGAVTLNIVAGSGMLAAGILGSVLLGSLQDHSIGVALARHDAIHGSQLTQRYLTEDRLSIFGGYRALDPRAVALAPAEDKVVIENIAAGSKKSALSEVALLPVMMLLCYLALLLFFRSRGGYRAVVLDNPATSPLSRARTTI